MAKNNKCNKCGGSLEFDPTSQNLICKKCGNCEDFEKGDVYKFHSFDMNVDIVEPEFNPESVSSHCPNCGAIFTKEEMNISDSCTYCGSHLTVDFSLSKASAPDACIPFAFGKEDAKKKFKEGLKSKFFLPNKFIKEFSKSDIESVYVPAYLFNISTENEYVGRIYRTYRDSDGDSHRSYRNIRGTESVLTKNLLVECSSQLNQLTLDKIRPFDLNKLMKYSDEYLMGYSVEYYDKKLQEAKSVVKESVEIDVRRKILDDYSYDGIDYLNINTTYKESNYSRVILPTYRFTYKYKNKNYSTFLNGQTGKVGGNLPRSGTKIFFFVLGILAAVGLLIYFIMR